MPSRQPPAASSPSLLFFPPLLSLLLLLSLMSPLGRGMDVKKLCEIRCTLGKGGNLCNCNAFHFAGKRGGGSGGDGFQLPSSPLLEVALPGLHSAGGDAGRALEALATSASLEDVDRLPRGGAGKALPGDGGDGEDRRRQALAGGGLFDHHGDDDAQGGDERAAAVNRLASLIKTALDERLIDSYKESRKETQDALPYGEAEFLY